MFPLNLAKVVKARVILQHLGRKLSRDRISTPCLTIKAFPSVAPHFPSSPFPGLWSSESRCRQSPRCLHSGPSIGLGPPACTFTPPWLSPRPMCQFCSSRNRVSAQARTSLVKPQDSGPPPQQAPAFPGLFPVFAKLPGPPPLEQLQIGTCRVPSTHWKPGIWK